MGQVNVIIIDTTGNKQQKVGLPDDIKCGIIMVKLIEKIKLPSVGPDGNPISYKFIHKATGKQLLEEKTLKQAGVRDGDVLRLQPEITAGAICGNCGNPIADDASFCGNCGKSVNSAQQGFNSAPQGFTSAQQGFNSAPQGFTNAQQGFDSAQQGFDSKPPQTDAEKKAAINKHKKTACICGMCAGVLSVIFGFVCKLMSSGRYEYSETYGGDAYTGIQNAAAGTANNVLRQTEIMSTGFFAILVILGVAITCYFYLKWCWYKEQDLNL